MGLACTLDGATEYQKKNTPHLHSHVHLVNIYQYGSLADLAAGIENGWVEPRAVARFSQLVHCENPPDASIYQEEKEIVADAWNHGFGDGKHEARCTMP